MIFSTVKFTIWIDILRCTHLVTFEGRCLGLEEVMVEKEEDKDESESDEEEAEEENQRENN